MISQATFGTYHLHIAASAVWAAAVAQRECVEAELPHHGELGFGFRERKANALILRDRPLEGDPLGAVLPGFVHRRLGRADAFEADQGAAIVEAGHDLGKALVLLGHQAFGGDEHVIEEDRTPADRPGADVVEMRPSNAALVEIDKERADAAGAILDAAGTRKDNGGIALSEKLIEVFSPFNR